MFRSALILTTGVLFCLPSAATGFDHHRRASCATTGPSVCAIDSWQACDAAAPRARVAGGQPPGSSGAAPPPGGSNAGNPGTAPGTAQASDPELVRVLTESAADVAELRTVRITSATVNGGNIVLRGSITAEAQRPLLKTRGEAALRGYIDRGILRWPNGAAPPVLDVSQLVVNGGTTVPRRPQSLELDPQQIAAIARELAAGSTSKFTVGWQSVDTPPAVDTDAREVAEAWFGDGFHAYWSQDLNRALQCFQVAVEFAHDDARFWYYKGLTEYRLGDTASANVSLAQAVLRHQDSQSTSRIAKALERVQGSLRQRLEMARILCGAVKRQQPPSGVVAGRPLTGR